MSTNDVNHRPRKRFGQNFLHDTQIIDELIRCVDPRSGETFIEIGPGRGALTLPLLEQDIDLHAIEIDRDLAARWQNQAQRNPRFFVHCADALKVSLNDVLPGSERVRLIGNLPYNVSTPLLFRFVSWRDRLIDLHLMLQKEVVERMAAAPGNKTYGRLTVMLAPWFQIESLVHVGGEAFDPPPKVDSAFVRLTPHAAPPFQIDDTAAYREIVTAAFSMRRKTLRNGLRALLETDQIDACGIDPSARAETLAPSEFAALANALVQHRKQMR
ncbi:MAG: 16S rRNA (adenine(1518)-N(6)/adenine(1519)-N(6))-dimethyltransferase RsmA [Gammaproteobacteria bacterium]